MPMVEPSFLYFSNDKKSKPSLEERRKFPRKLWSLIILLFGSNSCKFLVIFLFILFVNLGVVTTPTLADLIKLKVRDWDQGAKVWIWEISVNFQDEDVGAFFLRFSDIGTPKNGIDICQPRWYNIYGWVFIEISLKYRTPEGLNIPQVSKLADVAKKMNEGWDFTEISLKIRRRNWRNQLSRKSSSQCWNS